MLVHLRLEDTEFIHLCLCRHAQATVTVGTVRQTSPEVRKLVDNRSIIPDGCSQITGLVMQESSVEDCHEVLGFHLDDEVEIGDSTVIITQLYTHQSSIIMSQEIVRIQLKGIVIIAHRPPEVIQIDTRQSPVDVTVHIVRLEMQTLGQRLISRFPFLSCQRHIGTRSPGISIIRIELQTLVKPFLCLHGIFLMQIHFSLERISIRPVFPFSHDGIQFLLRRLILFVFHLADSPVEPVISVARFQSDSLIIVSYRIIKPALSDATDGSQVINIIDIGIEMQRLAGITFGTRKVIQIKFCHTAVIPRLIQIRLGTDSQIKILD